MKEDNFTEEELTRKDEILKLMNEAIRPLANLPGCVALTYVEESDSGNYLTCVVGLDMPQGALEVLRQVAMACAQPSVLDVHKQARIVDELFGEKLQELIDKGAVT